MLETWCYKTKKVLGLQIGFTLITSQGHEFIIHCPCFWPDFLLCAVTFTYTVHVTFMGWGARGGGGVPTIHQHPLILLGHCKNKMSCPKTQLRDSGLDFQPSNSRSGIKTIRVSCLSQEGRNQAWLRISHFQIDVWACFFFFCRTCYIFSSWGNMLSSMICWLTASLQRY